MTERVFSHPTPPPARFNYESIAPTFSIWGWNIQTDPHRALEFMTLHDVSDAGLTLAGSGATTITTPALFKGLRAVDVTNASPSVLTPNAAGQITFTVDLGPADTEQEDTAGADTVITTQSVTFAPHAIVTITDLHVTRTRIRYCLRTLGAAVRAHIWLQTGRTRSTVRLVSLKPGVSCGQITRRHVRRSPQMTLVVEGHDRFGHPVLARRPIPGRRAG